jgi:hypothetical protein
MFKRKSPELKDIDLLNKFNVVENKIDILVAKFEAITYLDGCCECKKRETKIYEMLVDYFEQKFTAITVEPDLSQLLTFKTTLISELKNICSYSDSVNINIKDMLRELLDVQKQPPKIIDHQEYHIKHQTMLSNIKAELNTLTETTHKLDEKLRTDLQNFLLGLQSNIANEFKKNVETNSQQLSDVKTDLQKNCYSVLQSVDAKVDGFYFENELIKHQLQLEEEIRKYNDDIDSVKIAIHSTTAEIDKIFHHFDFNE